MRNLLRSTLLAGRFPGRAQTVPPVFAAPPAWASKVTFGHPISRLPTGSIACFTSFLPSARTAWPSAWSLLKCCMPNHPITSRLATARLSRRCRAATRGAPCAHIVRLLLPRGEEHLQNDGGPRQSRHGPLPRPGGHANWFGGGHNAVAIFDNVDYLVFHGHDGHDKSRPKPRIEPLA